MVEVSISQIDNANFGLLVLYGLLWVLAYFVTHPPKIDGPDNRPPRPPSNR
jgi:hypothetical protein